jgi:hypothetical protein
MSPFQAQVWFVLVMSVVLTANEAGSTEDAKS